MMVLFSGQKIQGVRNHHSQLNRASGYNKHKHRSTRYGTTRVKLNYGTPEIFWVHGRGVGARIKNTGTYVSQNVSHSDVRQDFDAASAPFS